jgi:NAD(P)H-dependent FMN reductase
MPRIAIISSSPRTDSQSHRIAERMNQKHCGSQADIIDLESLDLPIWDGKNGANESVEIARNTALQADCFIVIVPEWNGMAAPAIKNFFVWCGAQQLAHKPALLVAISSGVGGAMVISEMRSSSYKNSRLLYIPEHLILRDVERLWVNDSANGEQDEHLENRTHYAIGLLKQYASALKPIRANLIQDIADFSNGMS